MVYQPLDSGFFILKGRCIDMNQYNQQNFQQEVLGSKLPVLVDLWAPWCGPCKRLAPIIDEIETQFAGKIRVGKLDISDNNQLVEKYRVMTIPTLLFFEKGKLLFRLTGVRPKDKIITEIQKYLERK
jgi:thioredoxin